MPSLARRIIWEAVFLFALLFVLDILPIGAKIVAPLLALLYGASFLLPPREKTLAALSVAGGCLLLNLVAPFFMEATYYREHEKLHKRVDRGFKRYAPNQEVTIEAAHGDLVALGSRHPEANEIREGRKLEFRADAHGYRDYANGAAPRSILVGDSFVVGNGNTQEHNLSFLLQEQGIPNYNLGHNGDIAEYLAALANARVEMRLATTPALLFAFEGNDFAQVNYCIPAETGVGRIRDLHRAVKEMHLARFLAALAANLGATGRDAAPLIRVLESKPGGPKVGFLEEYIDVATRSTYDAACLENAFANRTQGLMGIVFIPVKARVYSQLFAEAPDALRGESVYARELRAIAARLRIPFIDLTEPLRKAAAAGISRNEFVYWRDDTHWNVNGMRAAVAAILPLLKSQLQ